ncbi:MAG: organomercurial lyase [Gemmatimonadales bacterium]
MRTERPDLDSIVAGLAHTMVRLTVDEQRTATELYCLLAEGRPVSMARLAGGVRRSVEQVKRGLNAGGLKNLVYTDGTGSVIGFAGLAIDPTHHRLTVGGRTLYTWCAWDGLFIPGVLGETASIESKCPVTDRTVRVSLAPRRLNSVDPREAVVSFVLPEDQLFEQSTQETISGFCRYVYFFASADVGAGWTAQHEGTFLLSAQEAFELGQRYNALRFGAVLKS